MIRSILCVAAAALLTGTANAATILSENFESGPGAFTLNGNVALATGASYQPCCGTPPDTSNTFVAFGGGNNPSGNILSVSFDTILGELYTVNFDYGALGGGSESLTLQAAGQSFVVNPIADNSLVTTFQPGTFVFTGIGGSTTLNIFSGGVDNVDAIIDNVRITGAAVPEPGTWAMMLLGFGGIGFAMRRSRRSGALAQVA